MDKLFASLLGSSPITSIIQYGIAVITAIYPLLQDGNFDIKKDWINLLVAALIAINGRKTKDSNGVTAEEGKEMHEESRVIKSALINHGIVEVKKEEPEEEETEEVTGDQEIASDNLKVTAPKKKTAAKKIVAVKVASPVKKKRAQ